MFSEHLHVVLYYTWYLRSTYTKRALRFGLPNENTTFYKHVRFSKAKPYKQVKNRIFYNKLNERTSILRNSIRSSPGACVILSPLIHDYAYDRTYGKAVIEKHKALYEDLSM